MTTKYVCRKCESENVEGTLPVWFKVNTPELDMSTTDAEADFMHGFCLDCENDGGFDSVARAVEIEATQ